jgi:tRNA pseudouridine32 synthase/23S rRNA pseudouridine746 synthase
MARLDATRGWWMKVDPLGMPARTRWRLAGSRAGRDGKPLAWLELEPLTGRTHQLRVHCAAMGWPIMGDPVYGTAPREGGPGLHLLARRVSVPLYRNKDPVEAEAGVPAHMADNFALCGRIAAAP